MKEEFLGFEVRAFHDGKGRMFDSLIGANEYMAAQEFQGLENIGMSIAEVQLRENEEYPIPQDYKEGYTTLDDVVARYFVYEPDFIARSKN